MGRIFDKKNIILAKIQDDDLNSFLVDAVNDVAGKVVTILAETEDSVLRDALAQEGFALITREMPLAETKTEEFMPKNRLPSETKDR